MKMPPPPWELSVTLKPSMVDGLQVKLLGYGLVWLVIVKPPKKLYLPVWQYGLASPVGSASGLGPTPVSSVVTAGNAPASVPSFHGAWPWNSSPLARTVMPAPS